MPQDNLFNQTDTYFGLDVKWEEVMLPEGRVWNLTVRRQHRNEGWQTVHVSQWEHEMLDLGSTLMTDAFNAFMYDEPRGLQKACVVVLRLARRHAIRCRRLR